MNVFKLQSGVRLARLLAGLGALVTMLVVTGTAALAAGNAPAQASGVR